MPLLSDNDAKEVKKIFGALNRDVHVRLYTQKLECPGCQDTEMIMKELDQLSDKLKVEFLNAQTDSEKADSDGIEMAPAIVVSDGSHSRVKFYGTPSGYEFSSLLTTIVDSGGGEETLAEETVKFLDELDTDLLIQVFVTPTCPHCPSAAVLACRMAEHSEKVSAQVIEANEFPELSRRFRVQGVPRSVINGKFYAEGALPESMMISALREGLNDNPQGEKNLMEYIQ